MMAAGLRRDRSVALRRESILESEQTRGEVTAGGTARGHDSVGVNAQQSGMAADPAHCTHGVCDVLAG